MSEQTPKGRNRNTAVVCGTVVAGMVALSFAAVPLYQIFCQVTGFGGTTQRAEAVTGPVLDRTMKVRFDGNVGSGLPWEFKPVDRQIELKIGEQAQGTYRATNVSDRPTTGTATFNVSPSLAGAYFVKIECFCFTEQTLQPGESVDMPVMFYIDPDIAEDSDVANLGTITLSYTFYPAEQPAQVSQADAATSETAQQPQ
ncbi:MAG: cytochrome c oxidase assembly protein [Hyphomicrobiales bacterium]